MSDLDATTPRVFLARHGETEWTISGRQTGTSDIPLTELGERQVASTARVLVGPGKLLDPARVKRVWVSPRQRAVRTFQLLFGCADGGGVEEGGVRGGADGLVAGASEGLFGGGEGSVLVKERIREWDYGDYEGLMKREVDELRRQRGVQKDDETWSVWRDGCEGGESKQDVETRLDELIEEIKELQRPCMHGARVSDVVLVAHGLILRCFAKRWLGLSVDDQLPIMFSPGSIAMLSYKDHNVDRPAFYMGLSLPPSE